MSPQALRDNGHWPKGSNGRGVEASPNPSEPTVTDQREVKEGSADRIKWDER